MESWHGHSVIDFFNIKEFIYKRDAKDTIPSGHSILNVEKLSDSVMAKYKLRPTDK